MKNHSGSHLVKYLEAEILQVRLTIIIARPEKIIASVSVRCESGGQPYTAPLMAYQPL